jgi:5-methylcytosine-specific restriction protein B
MRELSTVAEESYMTSLGWEEASQTLDFNFVFRSVSVKGGWRSYRKTANGKSLWAKPINGAVAVAVDEPITALLETYSPDCVAPASGLQCYLISERHQLECAIAAVTASAVRLPHQAKSSDDSAPVQHQKLGTALTMATNTILYGPPGTGKTYATTRKAVELCDGQVPYRDDEEIRQRFEQLRLEGRVSFVTFHQSYGYEEFVEGLRPVIKEGQIAYEVLPGAFKRACQAASLRGQITPGLTGKPLKERTLYKMSLGASWNQEGVKVFEYCVHNSCVLLGYGNDIDFSDCSNRDGIVTKINAEGLNLIKLPSHINAIERFKHEVHVGDLILVSSGNKLFRAIAEVTGEYEYIEDAPFHQMRAVRWLAVFEPGIPAGDLYGRGVTMNSLYTLNPDALRYDQIESLLASQAESDPQQPHVLIIDEINRANISKVFGELITLIEPDKREGQFNAITVKLPYSGEDFSVPSNLHLLGTMNTADRSIALLDTALRRRFDFEELMPNPALLSAIAIDGVDLGKMLGAMNERIEALYDRDHTIGHAYLIGVRSIEDLDRAFRRKILPLLQEYFYENWSKVRRVLADVGDGDFVRRELKVTPTDGEHDFQEEPFVVYGVNPEPFPVSAYRRIYGAQV